MPKIITIPEIELFVPPDRFVTIKETKIKIEHSLVAIAKWESKWHVAFLDEKTEKTNEMLVDYIRCMTISQNVDPMVYNFIPEEVIKEINDYIQDPMTATTFRDDGRRGNKGEFVTNELVYYWMVANGIPLECEKWHFNRLMTLIRICGEKNDPNKKKMSKRDIYSNNKALNAARRAKNKSKG